MLTDSYIDYISGVRRYSERTCEIYSEALSSFCEYTLSVDDETLISALVPAQVRNYEVFLMEEKKLDPSTVNLHLSVLSGFCKFLVRSGKLESNPVRLVTRPKAPKRLPQFYREEAMRAYFEATESNVQTPDMDLAQRYESRLRHLIISMLYCTGMRRSELAALNLGDVDFSRKVVKVRGKGDKMREIPLVDVLCEEISLYLQSVDTMVGCEMTPASPLLLTLKGRRLYPVFIDRAVKEELGKVEGITGKKSPHVLRHTLATELLNEGTDLNSIKELLGHSSLAATQVYTHNSIEKLKSVYNNAHPRAKNGGNYGDKH